MGTPLDDAAQPTPPKSGAVYRETIVGAAAPNPAAIQLPVGKIVHFSSDSDFVILFGASAVIPDPDGAVDSSPTAPAANAGLTCFGGVTYPWTITVDRQFFRWTSSDSDQALEYYPASPGQ